MRKQRRIARAETQLTAANDRSPTDTEIAQVTGLTLEEIEQVRDVRPLLRRQRGASA